MCLASSGEGGIDVSVGGVEMKQSSSQDSDVTLSACKLKTYPLQSTCIYPRGVNHARSLF